MAIGPLLLATLARLRRSGAENEARRVGLKVMVGNMVGTSLAMAPAFVVGQHCDVVDLDGPTFLTADREHRCEYRDGTIWCSDQVWGSRLAA